MTELRDTVAYCGLICGVCQWAGKCDCRTAPKPEEANCYQRNCCIGKGIDGCWECADFPCGNGYFSEDHAGWRGLCVASVQYARDHGAEALVDLVVRKHGSRVNYGPYMHKSPEEVLRILQAAPAETKAPPGWRVAEGQWTVDDAGRIVGGSAGNAYIYRQEEHADDVRVTATMQAVKGIEITVWICGSPGRVERDGYTLAVSTEKAKLQRMVEDVVTDPAVTIQPGRDYVLSFERRGAHLRGFLGGSNEPFIEWADPEPLRGEGHRTLGFYIWDGTLAVSDVKVEDLTD